MKKRREPSDMAFLLLVFFVAALGIIKAEIAPSTSSLRFGDVLAK